MSGAVGQQRVPKSYLTDTIIPLAPLNEQKRIADKLDSLLAKVDACRERLDRVPKILKRFRQSVLAAAVSGELMGLASEEMTDVSLGEIIENGPQNGIYKPQMDYGSGTLIVRIDGFYDGRMNNLTSLKRVRLSSEELSTFGLERGDILVNRVNSLNFLGKSTVVPMLCEPCVFESNIMRLRIDKSRALPEYIVHFLTSPFGTLQLRRNAKHAVNQASINQGDVCSVSIPLPSIALQHQIVDVVSILFERADRIAKIFQHAESAAQALPSSLLASAFRGDLVPQDPNDEPASELLERISASTSKPTAKPRSARHLKSKGPGA